MYFAVKLSRRNQEISRNQVIKYQGRSKNFCENQLLENLILILDNFREHWELLKILAESSA
jgi:hypothetical protein